MIFDITLTFQVYIVFWIFLTHSFFLSCFHFGTFLVGVFLKPLFSHVAFYLFDRVDETPLQPLRCIGKVKDLLFGTEFPNGEENQQKDMKIYKSFF